jgi:hypothetical protein
MASKATMGSNLSATLRATVEKNIKLVDMIFMDQYNMDIDG